VHKPREAFDGGPYGLSQQRVVKDALPFLRPGGILLFEIGLGQERQVKMLFDRAKTYENIRSSRMLREKFASCRGANAQNENLSIRLERQQIGL
jgi:methylase of polypeptide subunit release factors